MSDYLDRLRRNGAPGVNWVNPHVTRYTPDPARVALRELVGAAAELTPRMPPADAPCHFGIVEQGECAHCRRIARLTMALNAARNVLRKDRSTGARSITRPL